jgi:hypothetical protein
MSGALDLYCALLDIEVPPEKAQAVVEALAALKKDMAVRDRGEAAALRQLQQGLDENWWDLRLKAMTDEITLKVGGLILFLTAWAILMHRLG